MLMSYLKYIGQLVVLDRDNDLASYHNYFDTNLANGLLPAGAVGRDNIAVLDPTTTNWPIYFR